MSEQTERLMQEVDQLRERIHLLERQMDKTAERQAEFGRPRYMMWGRLQAELPKGGAADVQLVARQVDGVGTVSWVNKWLMEDVLAPPVMPTGTCLPATNSDDEATWVLVAWFPLDEEYFVVGAEVCPTTDCSSTSSSS